jgi:hypothetical protein
MSDQYTEWYVHIHFMSPLFGTPGKGGGGGITCLKIVAYFPNLPWHLPTLQLIPCPLVSIYLYASTEQKILCQTEIKKKWESSSAFQTIKSPKSSTKIQES